MEMVDLQETAPAWEARMAGPPGSKCTYAHAEDEPRLVARERRDVLRQQECDHHIDPVRVVRRDRLGRKEAWRHQHVGAHAPLVLRVRNLAP
jgi:hypothetical protein